MIRAVLLSRIGWSMHVVDRIMVLPSARTLSSISYNMDFCGHEKVGRTKSENITRKMAGMPGTEGLGRGST